MNDDLAERLGIIHQTGLYRQLQRVDSAQSPSLLVGGRQLLNFSSNDYLGLANEPVLKEAAIKAIERFGIGSGASRLISGSLAPHDELEQTIAAFKGAEAALSFSSGYAAAIGTVNAMVGRSDVVVVDKLAHACIVDAARMCGAKLRVFAHNDLDDLERILQWAAQHRRSPAGQSPCRILVVTESVFSMDGDVAPLDSIVAIKEKYGAWLMVDEAHATGIYGAHRRGLAECFGVADRVEVQMGTLSKAIGAAGGFICGSRVLIDFLINSARSFIFSTAPSPAVAAAATAGIGFIQSTAGEERCRTLWTRVDQALEADVIRERMTKRQSAEQQMPGHSIASPKPSAIIPILIGDENQAVQVAARLRERGIYVPAIRFPTVARGAARLRLTVSAAHSQQELRQLLEALAGLSLPEHP